MPNAIIAAVKNARVCRCCAAEEEAGGAARRLINESTAHHRNVLVMHLAVAQSGADDRS